MAQNGLKHLMEDVVMMPFDLVLLYFVGVPLMVFYVTVPAVLVAVWAGWMRPDALTAVWAFCVLVAMFCWVVVNENNVTESTTAITGMTGARIHNRKNVRYFIQLEFFGSYVCF